MNIIPLLCAVGLPAGYLLIRRVPTCPADTPVEARLSIIIPARDEERNLPRLLGSINESGYAPEEVLVVDDGSTDDTAAVASGLGASVLTSAARPAGWTGKSWACYQGAQRASGDLLLFLDADTYFVPGGLNRMKSCWVGQEDPRLVLSILPYHEVSRAYEQLSIVFNFLMAAGAGGFGSLGAPQLFGQSLLLTKSMYFEAGGHAAVPGAVLENLRWAGTLRDCGARLRCYGGRHTLHMRMFPEGVQQMSESWAKAFTQGAVDSGPGVLAASVTWISALWLSTLAMIFHRQGNWAVPAAYGLLSVQMMWIGRQLGTYRFLAFVLFPLPLAYFSMIFGVAIVRRALGRKANWRGRQV